MQKYRNRLIIGFVGALIIYAIYLFTAELLTDESAFTYLADFPLLLIFPLVLLQLIANFFRWVEWHYYLGVIGERHKISVFDSLVLQFASFTMAVSPGKAGELLKSVILKTKTGTEISKSAPIVLAERVVDGIAVIMLMALAVGFGGDSTGLQDWQRQAILVPAIILGTGLVVVQIKPLAYFFLNLLPHIPFLRRMHGALVDFYESSREIFHLRHVIPMVIVGVGVYGCSALSMFLILVGFGQKAQFSLLLLATIMAGVSAAVGALSGSPNGAGATEASTQLIAVNALGISATAALAIGLLHGFFNKWFRVYMGLIIGFIFRKRLFVPELEAAIRAVDDEKHENVPTELVREGE